MKHIKILSDYTAGNSPNLLHVMHDDQGDVHIWTTICDESDQSIRLAVSGTRHSPEVRAAFYKLIKVYEEELEKTNQALLRAVQ